MILLLAFCGGADPGGGSRLQVFRQGIQGAVPKDGGDPAAKGYAHHETGQNQYNHPASLLRSAQRQNQAHSVDTQAHRKANCLSIGAHGHSRSHGGPHPPQEQIQFLGVIPPEQGQRINAEAVGSKPRLPFPATPEGIERPQAHQKKGRNFCPGLPRQPLPGSPEKSGAEARQQHIPQVNKPHIFHSSNEICRRAGAMLRV